MPRKVHMAQKASLVAKAEDFGVFVAVVLICFGVVFFFPREGFDD